MKMETLLINAGPVQRVTENGRSYLVADATILVGDQVLNGSKGKLFYSSRRCALNVGEWNKQPIVIYHPTQNGKPVAAHTREGKLDPKIIKEFGVGEVRNDSWDGKNRRVKLWFDEEHTRNKSPETYSRLNRGDSIELSTGLFTVDKPVANGRTAAGDDYTHEVEDWVPDHLAILPDQVGACSRRMGCGVNNAEKSCCDGKTSEESCEDCKSKTCEEKTVMTDNAFCPTGKDGGQDNSCGSKTAGSGRTTQEELNRHHAGIKATSGNPLDAAKRAISAVKKAHSAGQSNGSEVAKSASAKASKASESAIQSTGKKGDHAESAKLHRIAAQAHRDAIGAHGGRSSKSEAAEAHYEAAIAHDRIAAEHTHANSSKTNNQSLTEGDIMPFDRTKTIQTLTTNCTCWKGKEKTLNAMEDDALAILAEQAKELTENRLVVNSVRDLLGDEDLAANAMPPALAAALAKKKGETPEGEEEEEPAEEDEMKKPPVANKLRPVHERLTPDEIETLNIAKSMTDKAKRTLVDRLVTANSANAAAAKTIRPVYEGMTFKTLEKLVSALPTPAQRRPTNNHEEEDTILDFSGFGPAATTNSRDQGEDVGDDDMAPITFNESLYKTNLTPAK